MKKTMIKIEKAPKSLSLINQAIDNFASEIIENRGVNPFIEKIRNAKFVGEFELDEMDFKEQIDFFNFVIEKGGVLTEMENSKGSDFFPGTAKELKEFFDEILREIDLEAFK